MNEFKLKIYQGEWQWLFIIRIYNGYINFIVFMTKTIKTKTNYYNSYFKHECTENIYFFLDFNTAISLNNLNCYTMLFTKKKSQQDE